MVTLLGIEVISPGIKVTDDTDNYPVFDAAMSFTILDFLYFTTSEIIFVNIEINNIKSVVNIRSSHCTCLTVSLV